MTVSADLSTRTGAVDLDTTDDLDAGGFELLRDAVGPLVASGHRWVADVSRADFFGSAYVGALLGTLAVARRIPAVGSVLEVLRRLDAGDGPVLPLVNPEKLNC